MKIQVFISFFIALFMWSCGEQKQFGSPVTEEGAVSVDAMAQLLTEQKEFLVKVKGEVQDACRSEGCWLELATSSGETVFVTYKDKAFTIPQKLKGRTLIIEGRAYVDSVSIEDLQKEAREEGMSETEWQAITEPEYSLAIEAAGVLILD